MSSPHPDPPHSDDPNPHPPPSDHPTEETLELLVLAPDELSPAIYNAVTAHARSCGECRSVLELLLQFHRDLEAEVAFEYTERLLEVVLKENDAVEPTQPCTDEAAEA